MRPVAQIPNSVTVANLQTTRVDFAGLGALPPSATKTFDLTKLSGSSILANSSPKSRLWAAIAHAHLKGTVNVTATDPSVTISAGVDGLGLGVVAADSNVLRPGMPDYRANPAGPMPVSLAVAADNAYADLTFTEGVFHAADGEELVAADLALVFAANGGDATACAIAGVKKPDAVTLGAASALVGGETVVRVFLTVTGTPSGEETIAVNCVSGAVADAVGTVAPAAQTVSDNLNV
ncbi:MAG TPA: hypothetical protein VLH09_05090 [Bryobacteraceae bacterium]|nr:hypothetical protein [Bryobacteraceae bacterium]